MTDNKDNQPGEISAYFLMHKSQSVHVLQTV